MNELDTIRLHYLKRGLIGTSACIVILGITAVILAIEGRTQDMRVITAMLAVTAAATTAEAVVLCRKRSYVTDIRFRDKDFSIDTGRRSYAFDYGDVSLVDVRYAEEGKMPFILRVRAGKDGVEREFTYRSPLFGNNGASCAIDLQKCRERFTNAEFK